MINNDINSLEQITKKKVSCFIQYAQSLGLDIFIFEAKRTLERQRELFGQGRTAKECIQYSVPAQYAKFGKKITRTLSSKHLTGEAVDIVFDADKDPKRRKPTRSGKYDSLLKICRMFGLRNLAPLELCHFENDGRSVEHVIKENSLLYDKSNDNALKNHLHNANNLLRQ